MGGATILIVEDELEHGIELKHMLERNGHVVLGPAPDCSAALEILWRERPDFAFVDTHLGLETCEAVLEECAQQEVPVIITTSEITGTPDFVGDHHHLRKPLMQSMLGPAIETLRG